MMRDLLIALPLTPFAGAVLFRPGRSAILVTVIVAFATLSAFVGIEVLVFGGGFTPNAPQTPFPMPSATPTATNFISVRRYGAKCHGLTDDTAAIQNAFNHVPSGDTLVFPVATCLYSGVLTLSTNNVTLTGSGILGSVLQATTAADQAIVLSGNNEKISNMKIQGTGSTRLSTPQSTSLVVEGSGDQVINNDISGSASGGIFMYGAKNYLVKGNMVSNTLADGIHSTYASQDGIIENNTVTNPGDDMISVVSYNTGDPGISGHVLIMNNNVSSSVWGRGISCVGCDTVVIGDNTISGVGDGAGIYIANETESLGDNGVLAIGNVISNIENFGTTGQAGIDISVQGTYPVQYVSIEGNTVSNVAGDGIRELNYSSTALLNDININGNVISNSGGAAISLIANPGAVPATCYANTYGGLAYTVSGCTVKNLTSAAWTQFTFTARPRLGP